MKKLQYILILVTLLMFTKSFSQKNNNVRDLDSMKVISLNDDTLIVINNNRMDTIIDYSSSELCAIGDLEVIKFITMDNAPLTAKLITITYFKDEPKKKIKLSSGYETKKERRESYKRMKRNNQLQYYKKERIYNMPIYYGDISSILEQATDIRIALDSTIHKHKNVYSSSGIFVSFGGSGEYLFLPNELEIRNIEKNVYYTTFRIDKNDIYIFINLQLGIVFTSMGDFGDTSKFAPKFQFKKL